MSWPKVYRLSDIPAADAPDPALRRSHPDHVRYLDVDDHDYLYESCYYPGGTTLCGDAIIYGRVSRERADAVRRAARAYRATLGTTPGPRRSRADLAR